MLEQRQATTRFYHFLKALPVAGLLAMAAAIPSVGEASNDATSCDQWQLATKNTHYLAASDLYRICDDRLEALIIEDDHQTMVGYTIGD